MASILKVKDGNGKTYDIPAIRGSNAYEIAVKNGFVGTEKEWIESIMGIRGYSAYEVAVQNGFTGTEEEWLASLVEDRKSVV